MFLRPKCFLSALHFIMGRKRKKYHLHFRKMKKERSLHFERILELKKGIVLVISKTGRWPDMLWGWRTLQKRGCADSWKRWARISSLGPERGVLNDREASCVSQLCYPLVPPPSKVHADQKKSVYVDVSLRLKQQGQRHSGKSVFPAEPRQWRQQ